MGQGDPLLRFHTVKYFEEEVCVPQAWGELEATRPQGAGILILLFLFLLLNIIFVKFILLCVAEVHSFLLY